MSDQMSGAELASLLKGQINCHMSFKGLRGEDDPTLHLTEDDIKWWRDAKFGMFVHWGIYSVLEKGEWAYFNEKLDEQFYRDYAKKEFHPNKSAEDIMRIWTDAAVSAGMKYAVMVTRHHDGYALWDSHCSWRDFTSVRHGSGEDYVRAFVDATKEKGLYTGLYYSPMDWRFEGYFDPHGKKESAAQMKAQCYGQVEELCRDYGKVDILWYDGGWLAHTGLDADAAWFWEPLKLNKMVRSYNEKTMLTPRSGYKGDFECDEGTHEVKGKIVPLPWEKCFSLTPHWSYVGGDEVSSLAFVITMLVNTVCRDGNLLLNVAPDRNGDLSEETLTVLREIGAWMRENGEAVYGTRAGLWQPLDHVFGATKKENFVYLHILDCEAFASVTLPKIEEKILDAKLLSGEHVTFSQDDLGVKITLPDKVVCEHRIDTIVKLTIA